MADLTASGRNTDELFMLENMVPKAGWSGRMGAAIFLARISVGAVWDDVLKNNDHYDAMMTMKRRHVKAILIYVSNSPQQGKLPVHSRSGKPKYSGVRRSSWMEHTYILKKWNLSRYTTR